MSKREQTLQTAGWSRRSVLLGAAAGGLALGAPLRQGAFAQGAPAIGSQQTFTVSMWAGPFAKAVRENLVPDFEKDHGVKVAIEEGQSNDTMAKVRTEGDRPKRTVICLDEFFIPQLRAAKLILPLTQSDVPNLKDVFPQFVFEDGHGIGAASNLITLFYHTGRIATPPDSWAAMWNPAYRGRVTIPSAVSTIGTMVLMAAAAVATGKPISEAQIDLDPGFKKVKELKPNLYSIVDNSLQVAPLLAKGEIWLTPITGRFMIPYILQKAPLARAPLKEGGFMLLNSMALVANSPMQNLGKDFINRMLSEKVQSAMVTLGNSGPANSKVVVPPEIRPYVPWEAAEVAKLNRVDLPNFTRQWSAWQARWNAEIAG